MSNREPVTYCLTATLLVLSFYARFGRGEEAGIRSLKLTLQKNKGLLEIGSETMSSTEVFE